MIVLMNECLYHYYDNTTSWNAVKLAIQLHHNNSEIYKNIYLLYHSHSLFHQVFSSMLEYIYFSLPQSLTPAPATLSFSLSILIGRWVYKLFFGLSPRLIMYLGVISIYFPKSASLKIVIHTVLSKLIYY